MTLPPWLRWLRDADLLRWSQLWNQPLHFLWAAVALAPYVHWHTVAAAALSGFLIGSPREILQLRERMATSGHWLIQDTILDLAFFAAGGAAVGWWLG